MAKREVGEINAGSMADIAFLLLIFFLVTTTMEVDAGIGRQLPLKIDYVGPPPPPINKRNVLEILANSKDELLVEGKPTQVDELYDIVMDFYTVNKNRPDVDKNMPNYQQVTIPKCETEIAALQKLVEQYPDNKQYASELEKWKEKLKLCQSFPTNSYSEIHKSAVIQLKNQAGTTYGLYMEVQNILKQVVNELRVEACEQMDYPDYFELREDREEDQLYISNLRILVPERIIESKIDR
ncbi:ExbD/TolR family protein [Crocinitomix algicola]|uniref:ExbD/TolR family protein n=1 Tax=Crocinitomix algicola TaxID=1740263 RepID=UPI0008727649|nr:biopolymer transporter ExbD [Crocinitomix algicola]